MLTNWQSLGRKFLTSALLAVISCNGQLTNSRGIAGSKPGNDPGAKPGDDIEEWDTYVSDPIPQGVETKIEIGRNRIEIAANAFPADSRVQLRRVAADERDSLLSSAQVESDDELVELKVMDSTLTETVPVELLSSSIWVSQRVATPSTPIDPYFAFWSDRPDPPTPADIKILTKSSIQVDEATSTLSLTATVYQSIGTRIHQTHFHFMAGFNSDIASRAKVEDQAPIATSSPTPGGSQTGAGDSGAGIALVDKIVVAELNACMIRQGELKCWGNNNYAQIGHINGVVVGDQAAELQSPFPDPTGEKYVDVAIGTGLICAITGAGKVKCAGNNDYNIKGHGSGVTSDNFADAPTINIGTGRKALSIKAEGDTVCIVRDDHKVSCWGNIPGNGYDVYYGGDNFGLEQPTYYFGSGAEVNSVAVGNNVICALLNGGTVKCFGENAYGQLGLGNSSARVAPPSTSDAGDQLVAVNLGNGITAKSIAASDRRVCVTTNADELKCWGANATGSFAPQSPGGTYSVGLQASEMGNSLASIDFGSNLKVKAIASGGDANCAILDNNQVKCYGWNLRGQLGHLNETNCGPFNTNNMGTNLAQTDITGTSGKTVKSLALGLNVACAMLDSLEMKCWGKNEYGLLLNTAVGSEIIGNESGEMADNLQPLNLGW
jgi:hypothetical protein